MKWVLIWFVAYGSMMTSGSAQFDTQAACEVVAAHIVGVRSNRSTAGCYPTGAQ
jgi:hypothetical protein